ncbi:MAG: rod shape-determining protein MreC [Proteobacteria bacterium]|nr:rod shape-determining protein MreC [Pseudomonadota bacterium]
MTTNKSSSKIYSTIRAGIVACLVPVFFIYIMIDKPDYKIMNSVSGIVVPVAHFVADGVSFPFRIIGRAAQNLHDGALIMQENRNLRAQLDELMRDRNQCLVLMDENKRLGQELGAVRANPQKATVARIIHDNSSIAHNTFILNRGKNGGVSPNMAVVSFDGGLVGIVASVTLDSAKVRALTDPKSNIPVRVAGSDVYGFLRGNGAAAPYFEFYSDPEFMASAGNRLITSGIKGTVPDNIPVGIVRDADKTSASVELVAPVGRLHDVMVLGFDGGEKYK